METCATPSVLYIICQKDTEGIIMSASHEWTEYHLTPRGWEQGSWKIDFGDVHKKDPPPNRFLTCVYHERLSSVFSQMNRYVMRLGVQMIQLK